MIIKPLEESFFNKFLFSKYELDLISELMKKFGNYTSKEHVDYLHQEGSLWYETVKNNDLDYIFEINDNKSNFSIEFIKLIKDDTQKQEIYKSANDSLLFQRSISSKI